MAQWRLRSPGTFGMAFHLAMEAGLGKHVVCYASSRQEARALQEQWRLFQFCLRGFPAHHTASLLSKHKRRSSAGFDKAMDKWALWITVTESVEDLFRNATVR